MIHIDILEVFVDTELACRAVLCKVGAGVLYYSQDESAPLLLPLKESPVLGLEAV